MDILYYRIDRKSNLILFEDMVLKKTKEELTTELDDTADKALGQKTDAIFNSIIGYYKVNEKEKEKVKDKLDIIYMILEQYRKQKKIKPNDESLCLNTCKQIALKNYKTSFSFSSENMNEVATLLFFGFKKLKDSKKIINYDTFLSEIQNYKGKYYDLMQTYQKYSEDDDMIINEYEIPNELLLLLEVFRNVKTLEISIEEATHESIITYLLILFNSEWIFTMVFNLVLDLSCSKVSNEILSVYKKKFNKFYSSFLNSDELTDLEIIDKILENIQKEKEDKLNKEKKTENDKKNKKAEKEALKLQEKENKDFNEMLSRTYPQIIKNNSNVFDTLLLLINFIKKLPFINKLVVNIPDGYNIEINDYLRMKHVPGVEKIQFVDFLSTDFAETLFATTEAFNS